MKYVDLFIVRENDNEPPYTNRNPDPYRIIAMVWTTFGRQKTVTTPPEVYIADLQGMIVKVARQVELPRYGIFQLSHLYACSPVWINPVQFTY